MDEFLISSFVLSDNQPMYKNQANSGRLIQRSTGIQYFDISFQVNLNIDDRAAFQKWIAEHSQGKPFEMSLGYYSLYNGLQKGNVIANAASKNTYKITCTSVIEVGTLIQFSGHKKIYRVIANDGVTLSIFPSLRQEVQNNETIKYNDIKGTFILNVDKNKYEYKSEQIVQQTFTAVEDITS
ncbi:hypothetical protein [Candidatus Symbiopectobacterium sp. NZEC135]|uniref:hypothetical protein n=1 Tax=Candidatus Symbiopectobacterium sp. NZEC135 TaxID=2820471 RepID=UPI002226B758|nr:hypothetical protein [Candidatus Symbiopectobacterium sp. NZEC135]MCW2478117.1 hypothetical protein [Candidatus Symbiopectobacterium sp. NZEC135]